MGQTLIDISVEKYGTAYGVLDLIDRNPELFDDNTEFEVTDDLASATEITYDEESDIADKKAIKELGGKTIIS